MRAAREYKKNTKGGEEEKNYSLKFKNERDFLRLLLISHYDNGKDVISLNPKVRDEVTETKHF